MKKEINIYPRRAGKTTIVKEKFLENVENSILIVPNNSMKKRYLLEFNKFYNYEYFTSKIFVASYISQIPNFKGSRFERKTFLVDEFFMFGEELYGFYKFNPAITNCNWICFGTSNMLYDESLIKLTNLIKMEPRIKKFISEDAFKEIEKNYYCNLITEPDFTVYSHYNEMRQVLTDEQFKIEYLGRWLK